MTRRVWIGLVLLLVIPAQGQDRAEQRRQKALTKIGKKLGVPAEALDGVGGERYVARDPATRRALLEAIGRRPDGRLLPLVLDAARRERDFPNRVSAVKLIGVVGLEADREQVATQLLPELPRLFGDAEDEVFLGAADAINALNPWFGLDTRLVDLLERAFAGKNYRLAQRAFVGLVELQHPSLRAGVARRALLQVLDPKTRFSVFERKRAVLEAGRRGGLRRPSELVELMFKDGTVAIECAQALAQLGDRSVLSGLQRVDRTASHKLRIPAYEARAALGDESLLAELEQALRSDHVAIQRTLIQGLARLESPAADRALAKLAEGLEDEALRLEVALARLARGDDAGLPLVERRLFDALDKGLARRVLELEDRAAAPLVLPLARREELGRRGPAVDRLGAWGLSGDDSLALLRDLANDAEPSGLRLRAAASLLQLEDPNGVAAVTSALAGLTVVAREDVKTGAGQPARRYRGSVLVDVCQRWALGESWDALPLLAGWLDPPPRAPAAPADDGAPKATRTGDDAPPAEAPTLPAWLEHPWVRAGVVRALARLTTRAGDRGELAARGRRALARTLADPSAVVRAEALRGLCELSEAATLAPAASPAEEAEALLAVQAWLRRQG